MDAELGELASELERLRLIEQLSANDAREVGVNPDALQYKTIADLGTAGEKSVRDADGLPVAWLGKPNSDRPRRSP